MIVYRVYLDGHCNFKPEMRRKMHSEHRPIEKVLDQSERGDTTHHIYAKKVNDEEWTEIEWGTVFSNRSLHHGYVVKVPPWMHDEFVDRYCKNHSQNLHYGSKVSLLNMIGLVEAGYVFSDDGTRFTVHFPGHNYRCDAEYLHDDLKKANLDGSIVPVPKTVCFGLPGVSTCKDPFVSPVL